MTDNQEPSVFNAECPAQKLLARIADKWTTLVIYALSRVHSARYSELHRQIGGISQKMLTQTLRRLEEDGLIERTVFPVVPPRVEYRLTPLGQSLIEPLKSLCVWAEKHVPEMEANRFRKRGTGDRETTAA